MIDILMATYNGEKYIRDQLDSIINQTFTDWTLFISDDYSNDKTMDILKLYQRKYPNKIIIHNNDSSVRSAKDNFFNLIKYVKNKYVMFSDQDDIWLPDKIEVTLREMKKMEELYGSNIPLLVHTDLCVVDADLRMIDKSLLHMQDINYNRNTLSNLLVSNIVTGCTMMVNDQIIALLGRKPDYYIMHDWWLGMVAAAFGKIGFINKATILYRQHEHNCEGAKNIKSIKFLYKKFMDTYVYSKATNDTYMQAMSFFIIYQNQLSKDLADLLLCYSKYPQYNFFRKIFCALKYNFFKNNIFRIVGQLFEWMCKGNNLFITKNNKSVR